MAKMKKAKLIYREDLNDTLAIFRFELEGGVPDFEAGQYITMGLPDPENGKAVWRPYSISSPPEQKDYLELYIRWPLKPVPGKFTTQLWNMHVGEPLDWIVMKGHFTVEDELPDGRPDNRRLVMVGGGTGLAPFIAQALHLKHIGCNREIVICHGASYLNELAYRDLLLDLERESIEDRRRNWDFRYLATVSRPNEEANKSWPGPWGRVETLLTAQDGEELSLTERAVGERFEPDNTFFFICGYEGTIRAVLDLVGPRGFRTKKEKREDGTYDIKYESYG